VCRLATLIRRASEAWDPAVERAVFGTADADQIENALVGFVADRLGPVGEAVFYRPGVGIVAGLRLADSSEVVVKVHRWNVSLARIAAVQQVQTHAASRGVAAPRPLVAPEPLGEGIATVEELVAGVAVDGHARPVRQAMAVGLEAFVAATVDLSGRVSVGPPLMLRPAGAALWPEPHDVRFDFDATAPGAGWIDELARLARRRLDGAGGPSVVGHFDWRVENLGFEDGRIVAIYDWDSVAEAPEAVVVGNSAGQFTADWTRGEIDPLPSVEEMHSFVEDYENARGVLFGENEREILDAANLYLCAYGARCQHSDLTLHPKVGGTADTRWLRLLRERGEHALLE
jgi:hypothetical protein